MGRLAAWGERTGQARSTRKTSETATAPESASPGSTAEAAATSSEHGTARSAQSASFNDLFTRALRELRGVDLSDSDLRAMEDSLPDHLRMTFVVHDHDGRELGSGKDLGYLKRTLAGATDRALRTAVRQALSEAQKRSARAAQAQGEPQAGAVPTGAETATGAHPPAPNAGSTAPAGAASAMESGEGELFADNLETFPSTPLPHSVESRAQGLLIRAFPALVPQGDRDNPLAGVRVMANASQARSEHRLGIANLLLRAIRLSTKRVSTRWTGREALMLTSTPYPSTEALIADAQLASVRTLSDTLAGERGLWAIRDASAFEDLSMRIRDRHEDQVYSIIEVVVRAMESWAQLQDHLAEASGPAYASLRDDVQAIASSLVFDGFIAATPLERLLNLPRYIQAQSVRLRKALRSPADVSRDEKSRAALSQIDEEVEELRELMDTRPFDGRHEAAFEELLWMREELRVSLFAQELGTARKISPQRMLAAIDRLHEAI